MSKLIDLTGQRYGRLTVIERAESSKQPSGQTKTRWRCRCDCGNEIVVLGYCLKSGNTQSCGCLNDEKRHERTFIDLTGQKFNKLTVIERAEDHEQPSGQRKTMWRCRCDCGNETIVTAYDLYHGHTKSCGCLVKEYEAAVRRGDYSKYNDTTRRIRKIYDGMLYRCYKKTSPKYKNYGGRGIIICEEWLSNYNLFEDWALNNGYEPELTIDRIDVNGNYEPSNCRWITMKEQAGNTTKTIWVELDGERITLKELSERLGVKYKSLYYRYIRGWPIERIVNQPYRGYSNTSVHYGTLNGELTAWGEKYCS